MGWVKKLLRRQDTHEQWLAKHPGKESSKYVSPPDNADERQATRSRMEGEMDSQRVGRDKSIANIDLNAADQASADQSEKDATATRNASPAEQGGQG